MKTDKLSDLVAVTAATFEKEHQKLRPILEQEARVQNRISQLDAQLAQVRVREVSGGEQLGLRPLPISNRRHEVLTAAPAIPLVELLRGALAEDRSSPVPVMGPHLPMRTAWGVGTLNPDALGGNEK